MSWKLDVLKIKNFKFFNKEFSIELDGKNLLVYGENGSGKSSISMAVFTLLESCKKKTEEIKKYFIPQSRENLRNVYSDTGDFSYIKAIFKEYDVPTPRDNKEYQISDTINNTNNLTDLFFRKTVSSSDIFSYRSVSELVYLHNSKEIDLFEYFKRDLFRFIELDNPINPDGSEQLFGSEPASDWWKKIEDIEIPLNAGGNLDTGTEEYQYLRVLKTAFKARMTNYLAEIQSFANDLLHDNFELPNVSLLLDIEEIVIDQQTGKAIPPRISLVAKEKNPCENTKETTISHLGTYFNEAKLSRIGIALRFAITRKNYAGNRNSASILCIDDLMISLDMGNRLPVLRFLLDQSQSWQILLFTHDRALYETLRQQITSRGEFGKWVQWEMYERDYALLGESYPAPYRKVAQSNRDCAIHYLYNFDYKCSANYLRKYAEELLKQLLPNHLSLKEKNDGFSYKELKGLIDSLNEFAQVYGFDPSLLPNIDFFRQHLMNPFSHADFTTQLYKREIKECIEMIDKFQPIIDSRRYIVNDVNKDKLAFQFTLNRGADAYNVQFDCLEQWDCLKIEGKSYFSDPIVEVVKDETVVFHEKKRLKFSTLYKDISKQLGYKTANPAPLFETKVSRVSDGLVIQDIIA